MQNLDAEISIATLDSSIESSEVEPLPRVQIPSQKVNNDHLSDSEDSVSNKAVFESDQSFESLSDRSEEDAISIDDSNGFLVT